jgi:hypothetical protein
MISNASNLKRRKGPIRNGKVCGDWCDFFKKKKKKTTTTTDAQIPRR